MTTHTPPHDPRPISGLLPTAPDLVATTGHELHREYGLMDFFRQFELTDRVHQEGITANLQHGVLTLTLPKAEKAKPRRIVVQGW
jgi:HSP20 family molecular chaperone IbpA